jgi:hypothetical protein
VIRPARTRRADPVELIAALIAVTAAVLYLAPSNASRLHGRGSVPQQEISHPVRSHSPARSHPGLSGLGIVVSPPQEAGGEAGAVVAP